MSALGNALLRAAKADPVPNGAEGRALAKLGVACATSPGSPAAPSLVTREASPAGISLAPIFASIAASAVVAALLFANYTHSARPSPRQPRAVERASSSSSPSSLAPSAHAVIAPSAPDVEARADVAMGPPVQPPAPSSIAAKPRTPAAARAASASSARTIDSPNADALGLELALVREAKKRLEAGDPHEAIAALDRYAARFADGTFAQEAAAVRVEALFASDDPATAIRAARLFFERYPASPYGRRIEALLRANR